MSLGFFGKRKVLGDSKEMIDQGKRLLKRYRAKMNPDGVATIEGVLASWQSALQTQEITAPDQFLKEAQTLNDLLDQHLPAKRKSPTREYIESISKAVLVALILRAFLLEAFKIPSGSMIPTLEIGDQIFVNKFIYGLRVPFTFVRFATFNDPKAGEVIVFIYPHNHDKDYIKRVVGTAGDTIEVRGGQLFINQKAVERVPQTSPCEYWDRDQRTEQWTLTKCDGFTESLNGITHPVIHANDGRRSPDFGPELIKPGHLFVMGDNRDNSADSRSWGQVPLDHVKGRAMFIWWPWSQNGLNWRRLFTWIH